MLECLTEAQLQSAYDASQSGRGFRVARVEHLRRFADYACSRGAVVCNVETYEIRGDDEVPRIDLGIYQGGSEEQRLAAGDRIALSREALQDVLEAVEQQCISCVFLVWTDEL